MSAAKNETPLSQLRRGEIERLPGRREIVLRRLGVTPAGCRGADKERYRAARITPSDVGHLWPCSTFMNMESSLHVLGRDHRHLLGVVLGRIDVALPHLARQRYLTSPRKRWVLTTWVMILLTLLFAASLAWMISRRRVV